MTLAEQELAAVDHRRRDRSYSDAHALHSTSKTSPNHADITTSGGDDVMMMSSRTSNAPSTAMAATTGPKKHHYSPHSGHHQGSSNNNNRPRSKSLDLHRHSSTPIHKKKYPHHHYKHIPTRTYSPGGCNASGRVSPSSPKLKGKMWIRPVTHTAVPYLPTSYPSSHIKEQGSLDDNDYHNIKTPTFNDYNDGPTTTTKNARQVTYDGSTTRSPAASFDDEMIMMDNNTTTFSFFGAYQDQKQGGNCAGTSSSPMRMRPKLIFGESGKPIKPIKPRSAFEHYTPTTTTSSAV